MPSVMLKYWPIQYIDDPFRGEGRNIGVMVRGNGQTLFRCIGDSGKDSVDTVPFSRISKITRENTWVFTEWVAWFRELASDFDSNENGLQHRLQQLEIDCAPFAASKEGLLEAPEGEGLEKMADWLYNRLVRPPRLQNSSFNESIEDFLRRSETKYADGFERNIEIEFTPENAPAARIGVNYALTGTRKALFKVIRFKGSREHLVKRVNDVIFTFQQAVVHGFTSRKFCFALTDTPTKHNEDLVTLLADCCTVIDITKDGSARELEMIVKGRLNEG